MQFKQRDIVRPANNENKSEAIVDLVIGANVYITPRWRMSLSYPERYVINKNKLIKVDKTNNKTQITKSQIVKDWYVLTWDIINEFESKTIDDLKEWDTLRRNAHTYIFKEVMDWYAVFIDNWVAYRMTQEDINSFWFNIDSIIEELYWITKWTYELIDEEKENKEEQITTPKEVALL